MKTVSRMVSKAKSAAKKPAMYKGANKNSKSMEGERSWRAIADIGRPEANKAATTKGNLPNSIRNIQVPAKKAAPKGVPSTMDRARAKRKK